MNHIYYIEDDGSISELVREFLSAHHYRVTVFPTIDSAKRAISERCPSLVLVDWNMPDGNGRELCRWIRSKWSKLPVIFLTVHDEDRDIITGFESGADDYVVKPFALDVLLVRIQALLRRTGDISGQYLSCGLISLDQSRQTVHNGRREVLLSPSEYQLLLCLLQNSGKTVTRQQLLERVWDSNGNFVNDNTLTVTMKRLREKLDNPVCLKTVRSIGYRMEDVE